ncbi:MAG: hypothetical protein OEW64_05525 [Gammaproteobacteria bacterium]|nr:hypothetical protein [Gammaproteobacteria bacterium]MDH5303540.1 hypothetical protein [Gammaproteobacteria bacterium]MDH5321882.1 hypothetical protein [Gammaproteobacteria bacterium]
MREISLTWGGAIKIAWSIAWRFLLWLIPVNLLAAAVVLGLVSFGSPFEGHVLLLVAAWYLLRVLWFAAIALGFLFAVKSVIGKSYARSSLPSVPESFRVTLVSE